MNAVAKVEEQKPKGVLATIASRYSMEAEVFKATVKGTVFPSTGTNEEFIAFLMVANEYRLNPITREIYAFPKKGVGIVPIVSIDGWVSLINSHPQFDGMECEAGYDDGKLFAYTCRIYRKDRTRPIVVTEYLSECKRETLPWQMPHRMLRHKSVMQCARYAFGFSGIYDDDEASDIAESARDITPPTPPAPPSPASPPSEGKIATDAEIIPPKRDVPKQPTPILPGDPNYSLGKQEAAPQEVAESETAEDPNQIIAEVIDMMSMAKTEEAIEEGYEVADFEARLTAFEGYVERARAIKKQHLDRVRSIAKPEHQAAEAPPTPPSPSLEEDPPQTQPQPPASGLVTMDDYRQYALSQVAKWEDAKAIENWWKETREVRQKFDMPGSMRVEIQTALQARMNSLDAASK